MTDIATATPAAVEIAIGQPTIDDKAASDKKTKPDKPDEAAYKENLAKAEKDHKEAMDKLNAVKGKLDIARPNKDSPTAKKQADLRAELKSIRDQQSTFKSSRGNTKERIESLEAQLKSRSAEQKAARTKIPYKSTEEIDREVQRLNKQVESGMMKLVDEKKTLTEITNLNKLKKSFAGFEQSEQGIAHVKAQIAELKKTMDNPEQKALSERYNTIAKELDSIKAEQDGAYKSLNSLRDERTTLQAAQQVTFQAIRAIKDEYYTALNAWRDWEREAYRQRQERQRLERESYAKEKRKKVAESKLEEASTPAFTDEIMTAEGLIRYFDPNTPAEQKALRGPSGFAAEAQRKVDASNIKGTVLSKKEDRDDTYFAGTGGKKGKKGKKSAGADVAASEKFNLPLGVIEELSKVNVEPPSNQSDVKGTIEKLKTRVEEWKKNQAEQTKKNISKAQAEIDKLEAEAIEEDEAAKGGRTRDSAKKVALKNAGLNGDASATQQQKQEKDAVADAAEELKAAAIEDKS